MRRARITLLSTVALLLTASGVAAADEAAPAAEQPQRRSAEILAHMDRPRPQESWLRHHLNRVHLHDEAGFAYTRPLSLAERDIAISVRGPALDGMSVGLSFEIRF